MLILIFCGRLCLRNTPLFYTWDTQELCHSKYICCLCTRQTLRIGSDSPQTHGILWFGSLDTFPFPCICRRLVHTSHLSCILCHEYILVLSNSLGKYGQYYVPCICRHHIHTSHLSCILCHECILVFLPNSLGKYGQY